MKIYLAARYGMRHQLREYASQLEAIGHHVVSRWIYTDYEKEDGTTSSSAPSDKILECVVNDVDDVAECNVLIGFNCAGDGRGGRHVEFGMAIGMRKRVFWVGEPENIFHHYPSVGRAKSWDDLMRFLRSI